MPQVPIFQGGLPQTSMSRGNSMVVQAPETQKMDYARTMAIAVKPIDDFAGHLSKMAEVTFARGVKAQSDQAETSVMKLINDSLYGEDGYLTQQGENAGKAYQGTVEKLQKGVSNVLGTLPQPVRDAVESRIQDRMLSAQTTMDRWNTQQTHRWHMESSLARQQSILEDASNHYADEEYLEKSWKSIVQELDYQARATGMAKEKRAVKFKSLYADFQSSRFLSWTQDDPVGALRALGSQKGKMSADAWGKLDAKVWRTAKPQLVIAAAGTIPRNMSRAELIQAIRNASFKTGIASVDELSSVRKAEVLTSAYAFVERDKAQSKAQMSLDVKNSLATIHDYGDDPNELTEEKFVAADPENGKKNYEVYRSDAATASWVFHIERMPTAAIQASIEAAKPMPGDPNYAEKSQNYAAMQKASVQVQKKRSQDPIAAAIGSGYYGMKGISDWKTPAAMDELAQRASLSEQIAHDYSMSNPKLLTKNEAKALSSHLETLNPADQGQMLSTMASRMSNDQVIALARQLEDTQAQAFILAKDPDLSPTVTQTYLRGKQAIEEKQSSVGTLTTDKIFGKPSQFVHLDNYYDDPELRDKTMDVITGIAAGKMVSGEVSDPSSAYKAAFKDYLGEEIEYNGRKVYLKDVTEYDLRRTVQGLIGTLKGKEKTFARTPSGLAFSADAFSRLLKSAPLVPANAANAFYVVYDNQIMEDQDGNRIVIEVEGRR